MQNFGADILSYLAAMVFVICWVMIVLRFIRSRYAKVRSVKAVITDKYKNEPVPRIQGTFKSVTYTVVFSVGTKKLAFDVSEYSFSNFRVGKKGTLTYKGDRLIDFK